MRSDMARSSDKTQNKNGYKKVSERRGIISKTCRKEDVETTEFTSDSATDSSYSSSTTKESENKKMIFVPA